MEIFGEGKGVKYLDRALVDLLYSLIRQIDQIDQIEYVIGGRLRSIQGLFR